MGSGFMVFQPGLGLTGSLGVHGIVSGSNKALNIVSDVVVTGSNATPALLVNQKSTGNILLLQDNGSAVFTVADGGAVTLASALTVANGGTGATSAGAARTNLGLAIGSDVQEHDAQLDSVAAWTAAQVTTLGNLGTVTTAADKMIYTTGADTFAETALTAAGRALLDDADAAAQRTTLGLGSLAEAATINNANWSGTDLAVANGGTGASITSVARSNLGLTIGTDVQAHSAILDDLAGLTQASDKIPYFDGSTTASTLSFSTSTGLGSSNTTIPSQAAIKTYVDNNSGVTISSDTNNYVTTAKGNGTLQGESDLTFDGSKLTIEGSHEDTTCKVLLDVNGYNQGITPEYQNGRSLTSVVCIRQVNDGFEPNSPNSSKSGGALTLLNEAGDKFFTFLIAPSNGNLKIKSQQTGNSQTATGVQILNSQFDSGGNFSDIEMANISFTAYHRSIPVDATLQSYLADNIGKIVVSNGTYQNLERDTIIDKPTISQAIPQVKLSSKRNEKACFGVVSGGETNDVRYHGYGGAIKSEMPVSDEDRRILVNSIGEGGIWICNINGNLENGDLITTCEIPGLGMKQDDDLLRNYTVAKITQDCNFRLNASKYDVEEFEHEGKKYRKAFVGCTYHCG